MGMTGCGLLPKEEELPMAPVLVQKKEQEYKVADVVRGDVQVIEYIRVNYVPSAAAKLSFSVGDEVISEVYVNIGDEVKKGDVLMELNVADQQDQLRQQQDRVDDLYLQLNHLYESRNLSLSQAQLQDQRAAESSIPDWTSQADAVSEEYADQERQIQNSITLAEMRMEELRSAVMERQIVAPFDGTIINMYDYEEGDRSVKDKSIITLANMDEAMFEVFSENGNLLQSGETYTVVCNDKEYQVVAKTAGELGLEGKEESQMYLSMVTPDPELGQGASGMISLVMEESLGTLWVPANAVRDINGQSVVYSINEDGFREMRNVEIGISNGKITEIKSGLEENEVVIVD